MSKRIKTMIYESTRRNLRPLLLGALAAVTLLAATDDPQQSPHAGHGLVTAKLIGTVRAATVPYVNVADAVAAGYQPLFGCVSGPDQGAMGIHYINLSQYGAGQLDATKPTALIYEPSDGGLTLVGVEYILDAVKWSAQNSAPPMLEGQAFQFVGSPNRFGLPAFFELHVWAWRDSPNGTFVDWNTRVTCENQ
jgi:hypothetical protein